MRAQLLPTLPGVHAAALPRAAKQLRAQCQVSGRDRRLKSTARSERVFAFTEAFDFFARQIVGPWLRVYEIASGERGPHQATTLVPRSSEKEMSDLVSENPAERATQVC